MKRFGNSFPKGKGVLNETTTNSKMTENLQSKPYKLKPSHQFETLSNYDFIKKYCVLC